METQTILKNKVSKVVLADDLDWHTEQGWEIVEGFDQDDVVHLPANEERLVGNRSDAQSRSPRSFEQYGPTIQPGFKPVKVRRRYYLLVTDRGKRLDDLRERVHDLTEQVRQHSWEKVRFRDEYIETIKELEGQLAEEQGERDHAEKAAERTQRQLVNERNRSHEFEMDLGKLRKAIGDLKFKEIVGDRKDEDDEDDED